MKNKTFQAKLAEVLVRVEICAIHGNDPQQKWIDGKCITLSGASQAITALIDSDLIVPATHSDDVVAEMRSILHDTGEKR